MGLHFIHDPTLVPSDFSHDQGPPSPFAYWKIGVGVTSVDAAVRCLVRRGFPVSGTPSQFEDVGYLLSIRDPEGNIIELLQDTFEAPEDCDDSLPLATANPHIGQITLKVNDIH